MRGVLLAAVLGLSAAALSSCSGDTEAKKFQDGKIVDACATLDFVIEQTADTLSQPFPYSYADLTNVLLYLDTLASVDEAGDGVSEPSTLPGARDILSYGDALYAASLDLAVKGLQPEFWQAGVADETRTTWEIRTSVIEDRCSEATAQFAARYGSGGN